MGANEITESLKNYDVHFGITSKRIESNLLLYSPIFEENLVLITPLGHRFNNQEEINFMDLDGEPMIFFPEHYHTRQLTMSIFNQLDIKPNIAFETSRTSSILSLVSSGLGIAFIFESHLKTSLKKNVNVIRINNPSLKRTIYTAIHQDRQLPGIVHDLHTHIVQLFKSN